MQREFLGSNAESQSQASDDRIQVSLPKYLALVISQTPLPVCLWAALSSEALSGGQHLQVLPIDE